MSSDKTLCVKILTVLAIITLPAICVVDIKQARTDTYAQSQGLNAAGGIVEYEVPLPNYYLASITAGPDGALWFTGGKQANSENYVGRITVDGMINEYPVDDLSTYLRDIALGPDHNLWFTNPDQRIGRVTPAGNVVNFSLPFTSFGGTFQLAAGSDGAMWFTEILGNRIGRIGVNGQISEFVLPTFVPPFGVRPSAIALGPDDNIWFGELLTNTIGRITPLGIITEFPLPTFGSQITDMTVGLDGALWFTMWGSSAIGTFTISGTFTSFAVPDGGNPYSITAGPDGALWFTDEFKSRVSRITTTGAITHIPWPTQGGGSRGITAGPDGNIWFVESTNNKIGKLLLPSFDICIQDDGSRSILKFNSTTGDYEFTNCSDLILIGTGSLLRKGTIITLHHYAADRRVLARIDSSIGRATASVQIFPQGMLLTITDRNTANNTCACTASSAH